MKAGDSKPLALGGQANICWFWVCSKPGAPGCDVDTAPRTVERSENGPAALSSQILRRASVTV